MTNTADVRTIGVVGAGAMGSGIAQVFAQAGFSVRLHDVRVEYVGRARSTIERSLQKFLEKGRITPASMTATLDRVHSAAAFEELSDCDLVVEAVTEVAAIKRDVFAHLDRSVAPHAILASNTSSIPISVLAEATGRPAQCVGMHFMNPVPLMPLVEVVRGAQTSAETIATVQALVGQLGKTPVESADRPGFIANRVLMPMINEAAFARMDQVGTAEAIDTVMKLGMGHPMGPLALADLIGIDVCVQILDVMRDGLGNAKYDACPLLRQMVEAGDLGRKTGRGFFRYDS